MNKTQTVRSIRLALIGFFLTLLTTQTSNAGTPIGLEFDISTLKREGHIGDNWSHTWAADDTIVTAMDDGAWTEITGPPIFHSMLYKITGEPATFTKERVEGYPYYDRPGDGWFAYGIISVEGVLYSTISKTQGANWAPGPFRGIKLLRSYDSGDTWHRVDKNNQDLFLDNSNSSAARTARELLTDDEMFFFEESERFSKGRNAPPFGSVEFVQNGRDNSAAPDSYVYIYSPEGATAHELLLARVPASELGLRSAWEYFSGWDNGDAQWSSSIEDRQPNLVLPEKNDNDEYFGWYSWLPSVVWNPGLQLYIMANGGTYAGHGLTQSNEDYYNRWMHTKSGSLGLWYSETPYGPWNQFFYTDHWTVDDPDNLTYQPKLSPKWISDDGQTMTLIWSDAMLNERGESHAVNYLWNQIEINIQLEDEPVDETPPATFIEYPTINNADLALSPTLSGYATDEGGAGFDNVRIAIKDNVSGLWLNFDSGSFSSAFSHTQALLQNTTVTETDWFVETSLPPGDFKLFALAIDADDNYSTNSNGSRAYTTRSFSVEQTDNSPPVTTITLPSSTGSALAPSPILSGTATDEGGAGFDNVRIAIKDNDSGQWLDFDSGEFTTSFSHTQAQLENTTVTDTDWFINTPLRAGNYRLLAQAIDQDGNHDQTSSGSRNYVTQNFSVVDSSDDTAPLTFIDHPARNDELSPNPRVAGTATDEGGAGFDNVRIAIKDNDSGQWLDFDSGEFTTSFSHTQAQLENTTVTDTDWFINTPLQAGNYKLFALAIDSNGNYETNANGSRNYTTRNFSIE